MTLTEAVQAISMWLTTKGISGVLTSARTLDESHFAIHIREIYPGGALHSFEVEGEETPDCWKVKEV